MQEIKAPNTIQDNYLSMFFAGGVWDYKKDSKLIDTITYDLFQVGVLKDVKTIIQEELKDMDVTIVHYKK